MPLGFTEADFAGDLRLTFNGYAEKTKILVVDDDPAIRIVVRTVLLRQGYEALEAEDGLAAYELLHRFAAEIHLVVTDVNMPRMDGVILGQKVSDEFPNIEVLFMSGFISEPPKQNIPSERFLPKPLAPSVLVQRKELIGAFQYRMAVAWQRVDDPANIQSWFLRDSPGFPIVPELAPSPSEAVLDKITMSAFEGTPLAITLRDYGIHSFIIVGVTMEIASSRPVATALTRGSFRCSMYPASSARLRQQNLHSPADFALLVPTCAFTAGKPLRNSSVSESAQLQMTVA